VSFLEDALDVGIDETPLLIAPGMSAVVARDTWQHWGALYCWGVGSTGDWGADVVLARRSFDGGWDEMISGGMCGAGDLDPWAPPVDSQAQFTTGVRIGRESEDENGNLIPLVVQSGFAAANVTRLRVRHGDHERLVPVYPRLNAFVILGAAGEWQITALGASGGVGPETPFRAALPGH
jgi:hypothetical protein